MQMSFCVNFAPYDLAKMWLFRVFKAIYANSICKQPAVQLSLTWCLLLSLPPALVRTSTPCEPGC